MGGCSSVPDKAQRERSEAIDRQIEEDSRQFKKECKILLLGALSSAPPLRPLPHRERLGRSGR